MPIFRADLNLYHRLLLQGRPYLPPIALIGGCRSNDSGVEKRHTGQIQFCPTIPSGAMVAARPDGVPASAGPAIHGGDPSTALFVGGGIGAALEQALAASAALGAVVILLLLHIFQECGIAMSAVIHAPPSHQRRNASSPANRYGASCLQRRRIESGSGVTRAALHKERVL